MQDDIVPNSWVRLTRTADRKPIWINLDHARAIQPDEGGSLIQFPEKGAHAYVLETPIQILALMGKIQTS